MLDSIVFVNREFENGLWWWVFIDFLPGGFWIENGRCWYDYGFRWNITNMERLLINPTYSYRTLRLAIMFVSIFSMLSCVSAGVGVFFLISL